MHLNDLLIQIHSTNPKLEGWCTGEKAEAMAKLVVESKPTCCVEIGIFGGRSLIAMAMAMKMLVQQGHRGIVHGIDPWTAQASTQGEHAKADADWWSKIDHEGIFKRFYSNLLALDLTAVCSFYRTTSERAVHIFDAIDILHIDGNHSDEVACRDVELYYPKVKEGGYIWFDDTDWPTTKNAWTSLQERCEKVYTVGSCILYKKKEAIVARTPKRKLQKAAQPAVA